MSSSRNGQTYKWLIVLKHVWKQIEIDDSESISHNNGIEKEKSKDYCLKKEKSEKNKFLFLFFFNVVNEKNKKIVVSMFLHC